MNKVATTDLGDNLESNLEFYLITPLKGGFVLTFAQRFTKRRYRAGRRFVHPVINSPAPRLN